MEDWAGLSQLIEELYEAASNNISFWPLAPKIAAAFGSGSCTLFVRDGFAGPIEELAVTDNHTPEHRARYQAYYYQHDIWANLAMGFPKGTLLSSDQVITDDAFREAPIYRDHARYANCLHAMGALLPMGGPGGAFGVFGVHRSEAEGRFEAEDRHKGALFLPHLKRALQLREKLARLEIQQGAANQATDALAVGIMLVTGDLQLIVANPMAESILRRRRGLYLHRNRLVATSPAGDSALRRLIYNAAHASVGGTADAGGLLQVACDGAKPLTLSIYPFAAPFLSDGRTVAAALVFVSDPDLVELPRREVLAQLYRLTAAEARLFEALLAGMRLQDYADQSSLSRETVKTQLARLFDKTGHARQTELVRDALRNPLLNLKSR
jgi:DNA-binding CsgD family transcriptional regulator